MYRISMEVVSIPSPKHSANRTVHTRTTSLAKIKCLERVLLTFASSVRFKAFVNPYEMLFKAFKSVNVDVCGVSKEFYCKNVCKTV